MNSAPTLILASRSPRRSELLQQIGVHFTVMPSAVEELRLDGEEPEAYVSRLSREKAQDVWEKSGGEAPVLGADTIVVCDDVILEKPANETEAVAMLLRLSNRKHQVMTAVSLVSSVGVETSIETKVSTTDVVFRAISEDDAQEYWLTGEPRDKAGGYGIQGLGAVFVQSISGSYSNVVGLPLEILPELFSQHGIHWWQT
ncbi:MAG: Maf family nucleotide pyrophosphatase [Cellvibrionaceae bacterium]